MNSRPDEERGVRVCVDLTPIEMFDRHGGIGKYAAYLLEALHALVPERLPNASLWALARSDAAPILAERALEDLHRLPEPISMTRHRAQRRWLSGSLVDAGGFDLFHATQPAALPVRMQTKMVATAHDLIPIVWPRPSLARPVKLAAERLRHRRRYARAERVIAISKTTRDDLVRELHINARKIRVVPHGVDTARFSPVTDSFDEQVRREHRLPSRYFVCVSSDHYRKNHKVVFDAWCAIASDIEEGLVFVGRPLYETTLESIEREVDRLGIHDRFRWLKGVADEELPALYRQATACVAPSLYEGFGMTLLEAMAAGTPVVAAHNGAYDEVAGSDAVYFDPHAAASVADALRRIVREPGLSEALRARGAVRARQASWTRCAERTLDVYREVLFGPRVSPISAKRS